MNSRDLILTARGLTELSPRRPNQANLRRAVSTAYYAVFHCLAGTAANLLVGRSRGSAIVIGALGTCPSEEGSST